jgi:hypothetical protein
MTSLRPFPKLLKIIKNYRIDANPQSLPQNTPIALIRIRLTQMRIGQIRPIQIRLIQIRPNQNCIAQIGSGQICLIQIGIRQICATQINSTQIHISQIRCHQVQIAKITLTSSIPTQKLFRIHLGSGEKIWRSEFLERQR